jgi:peptidoglycan/LPS O-acetylase OafA/YrhL
MSGEYIPSIDGLRAVAITLVVGSHYGLDKFLPGGFGVTLFFFISGYLITSLLIAEHEATGAISIQSFYIRRFLRLVPALLLMLSGISLAFYLLNLAIEPIEIGAGLFYFMNYYLIIEGPTKMPIGALWSLAVEEHYYLFFPAVFSLCWKWRGPFVQAMIVLCGAALLWRIALSVGVHAPANRTYLGTDTRIDSILFGAILAAVLHSERSKEIRRILESNLAIGAGLGLLLLSLVYRDPFFRETARYTIQGIALMTLFYSAVFGANFQFLRNALEGNFVIWIGKLSYAIYLWHEPVQFVVDRTFPTHNKIWLGISELAITVALASASYYLVELYFQRLRKHFRPA